MQWGGRQRPRSSVSAFSSARLDPTAGGVTEAARLHRALNAKEHNMAHVRVKIRRLDFVLKAVRGHRTIYKLGRAQRAINSDVKLFIPPDGHIQHTWA